MNAKRIWMVSVVALVLAATMAPNLASAQQLSHGKFTLPCTTYWGGSVLPAGDYTFTITRATLNGAVVDIRGEKSLRIAAVADRDTYLKESFLNVKRSSGTAVVSSLQIAASGIKMTFAASPAAKEMLASAPSETDKFLVTAN